MQEFQLLDPELIQTSLWQQFLHFWQFEDRNALWVLMGSILLGMSASVIGGFAFLRKRSLLGDALAHAALPGVMMAFLLSHSRDAEIMFLGAITSSFIGFFIIDWLPKNTKIKPDAALAITLSFFFAFGLMLLSYIQGLDVDSKSGLDKILFGQAAAMTQDDIKLLAYVAAGVLITTAIVFQKFRLIAFNRIYAQSLGINIKGYEFLLALLIVLSVVVGLQLVGVVLMAAVLLTPFAAARFWSHQLSHVLMISAFFGALSALISSQISYLAPAMPTGPWMVVTLSVLFFISLLVAPKYGLIKRYLDYRKLRQRVIDENVLRTLYKLNERRDFTQSDFTRADILELRSMKSEVLNRSLQRLSGRGLLTYSTDGYRLSNAGMNYAMQLTRRHRLWENYLSEQAQLSPQQVHSQAERIEHLLNDEEELALNAELKHSDADPHGRPIPKLKNRQ